MYCDLLP